MDFGVFIVSNRRVKTKEQKDRDPTIWRSGWRVTWFSFSLIVLLFSQSSPWPKGGGEKDSIVKRMEDGTNIIIPEEEGGKKLRPTRVRKKKNRFIPRRGGRDDTAPLAMGVEEREIEIERERKTAVPSKSKRGESSTIQKGMEESSTIQNKRGTQPSSSLCLPPSFDGAVFLCPPSVNGVRCLIEKWNALMLYLGLFI